MARSPRRQRIAPKEADVSQAAAAVNRRQIWEASDAGQARMQELQPGRGVSKAQHYGVHGWGAATHVSEPTMGGNPNQQLPGLEHAPEKAFEPTHWEDLPDEEKSHALSKLAQHGGTDLHTMQRTFGAQMDQGYIRGAKHSTNHPYAEQFYSPGSEEHKRMASSAKELGVPFEHHVVYNAVTSPQSTFKQVTKSGAVSYPNDELAKASVRQGQTGVSLGKAPEPTKRGNQSYMDVTGQGLGMHKNARAAVNVYHQLRGGTVMQPKASLSSITQGMAEKTGPYTNAWSGHPDQFLVSDRHTGQGGFLPHLSQDEGERAMGRIPHYHAMADYAARQAMHERGYTHLRMGQAAQWGEEKIQKSEVPGSRRSAGTVTEQQAYQPHLGRQFEGQGEMFRQGHFKEEKPKLSSTPEGKPNQFAPGSQWTF